MLVSAKLWAPFCNLFLLAVSHAITHDAFCSIAHEDSQTDGSITDATSARELLFWLLHCPLHIADADLVFIFLFYFLFSLSTSSRTPWPLADLHAITVPQDPATLRKNTRDAAISLLACGVDPNRSILFQQSAVRNSARIVLAPLLLTHTLALSANPSHRCRSAGATRDNGLSHGSDFICGVQVVYHSELAWILGCLAQTGELNRMTQWKVKAALFRGSAHAALQAWEAHVPRTSTSHSRHARTRLK